MSAAHQCKLPSFQAITETNPDAVKPEKQNVTPAQPQGPLTTMMKQEGLKSVQKY